MSQFIKNHIFILRVCVITLALLSFFLLKPAVAGDSTSYLEAIHFLQTGVVFEGMIFNRIITTFGGLWTVIGLETLLGNILVGWFAMNAIFFAYSTFVFYKILENLFKDRTTPLIGALFFAGNYAMLRFGLNYLMDVGGWAFYIFSLYFTLRYIQNQNRKDILFASIMVGIGGLFKEYAFLGSIPIACILIYENWRSLLDLIKQSIVPALIALVPIALVYLYAYLYLGYTYIDWLSTNQATYEYPLRVVEYVKSFGSLLNILGILFVVGLWVLRKEWTSLEAQTKLFLLSVFASFLPIFLWPAITQRILFITIPFVILVTSFFMHRYNKYCYAFFLVLILYVVINLFMDSFILNFINLPL